MGFPPVGGGVKSVSSADSSIAVTNSTTTPVLQVATMDVLFGNEKPTASVALNNQKITGLANGTAATDAAAFGQIPTGLVDPTAAALGYKAWSIPPSRITAGTATSAGWAFASMMYVPAGVSLTGLVFDIEVVGTSTVPTDFRASLANTAGKVVAMSNNLNSSASLTTLGKQTFAFSGAYVANTTDSANSCYFGILWMSGGFGGTQPTFGNQAAGSTHSNDALSGSPAQYGAVSIPGGFTVGTTLSLNFGSGASPFYWMGAY